ncbi:nucleoside deaminase [bacterium]|nr:nucleoside deaminase [bacterium]
MAVETKLGYIYGKNKLTEEGFEKARHIILGLQEENAKLIEEGYGPFLAAIYDKNGKLIAKMPNTVSKENCCLCHAEVNTIKKASEVLKTYDFAPLDLDIYVTAEPCIMCAGAIMWSGIKRVFYSVNSSDVERITGFDEGFKPNWIEEFSKRNIEVYGEIESNEGIKVLEKYVASGKEIYKPSCER